MMEILKNMTMKTKLIIGAVVALLLMALLFSCGESEAEKQAKIIEQQQAMLAQQQAMMAQQQAAAPVVNVNGGGSDMSGVLAGVAIGTLLADGTRYNGHNGYNDPRYRGPKQTTKIVNNYYGPAPTAAKPVAAAPAPVVPVVPTAVPPKVKNAGDAAAELERQKMAQEAARKADIEKRKATLEAQKAARTSGSTSGGFLNFSKSASKPSGGGISLSKSSSRSSSRRK